MPELAPKPNPDQQQLEAALVGAQEAAREAGPSHLTHIEGHNLLGEVSPSAPSVYVSDNEKFIRADVRKNGGPEGATSKYHAVVASGHEGRDDSFATVSRTASNGEAYKHSFKNPNTARKMATLMLRQVQRRADAAAPERELTKVG